MTEHEAGHTEFKNIQRRVLRSGVTVIEATCARCELRLYGATQAEIAIHPCEERAD